MLAPVQRNLFDTGIQGPREGERISPISQPAHFDEKIALTQQIVEIAGPDKSQLIDRVVLGSMKVIHVNSGVSARPISR
jgi:hypothetical protein